MQPAAPTVVHGTCVAFGARGVLILGPSGAGKSALGLMLLSLGARLVADDQVQLSAENGNLLAAAPPGLPPWIEARGIGLLGADLSPPVAVALVVDLGMAEPDRLPPRRTMRLCDITVEMVHGPVTGHFPAAIRQYMMAGRKE
jgi:HPr kinase/phosphorylase